MKPQMLYIDNMVCHRCILAVEQIMNDLGWKIHDLKLGKVNATSPAGTVPIIELESRLNAIGFSLREDRGGMANVVKGIVISHVYNDRIVNRNLSDLISGQIFKEYSYISRRFSAETGRTIEAYYTDQRMERARNLLATSDLPIAEIGALLKYSAASHFSAAFRRVDGISPSAFRKRNDYVPVPLDKV